MTTSPVPMRITIWHNILWSKYKGEVFSALHRIRDPREFDIRFFQIAETEGNRIGLANVDMRRHRYPHTLLFKGAIDKVNPLKRVITLLNYTRASDADLTVLAGFEKYEYWAQLFLLRLMRRKVAVFCDSTIHDRRQGLLRGLLKRVFFRSVHGFFCYGKRSRDYVIHYGADPRYVFKRCQAAALPFDYSSERVLDDRIAHVAPQSAPCYLYVGRLSPEKGLYCLLDAFVKVRSHIPQATLRLVGQGPERDALVKRARDLGLGDAVTFVGSKDAEALAEEYMSASCMVLPSTSEPWGLVVNEALAYGCPAIVSDRCGCINELIVEGTTGFSHKADDVADLAQKMIAAPAQFADITATARECITLIAGYSPEHAAEQILAGLRVILNMPEPDLKEVSHAA